MCRHVVVRGIVQGVGYRAFVADEALRYGLLGWVRNRRDGTVEAVFEGDTDTVERVIAACRRGPWGARVDDVAVRDGKPDERALAPAGERFMVLPTA